MLGVSDLERKYLVHGGFLQAFIEFATSSESILAGQSSTFVVTQSSPDKAICIRPSRRHELLECSYLREMTFIPKGCECCRLNVKNHHAKTNTRSSLTILARSSTMKHRRHRKRRRLSIIVVVANSTRFGYVCLRPISVSRLIPACKMARTQHLIDLARTDTFTIPIIDHCCGLPISRLPLTSSNSQESLQWKWLGPIW